MYVFHLRKCAVTRERVPVYAYIHMYTLYVYGIRIGAQDVNIRLLALFVSHMTCLFIRSTLL